METIITLLLILIPVIFKAIGKKLENSSKPQSKQPIEDWTEVLKRHIEAQTMLDDGHATQVEEPVVESPVKESPVVMTPEKREFTKAAKQPVRKPVKIVEEKAKREKIDPKKLIIYSEIMTPKYTQKN